MVARDGIELATPLIEIKPFPQHMASPKSPLKGLHQHGAVMNLCDALSPINDLSHKTESESLRAQFAQCADRHHRAMRPYRSHAHIRFAEGRT
jgi:hypothetical protein